MRTLTALATLFVLTASFEAAPLAQADSRARLRLTVVDEHNTALPNATVTVFTLDGNPGVTATADRNGVVVFETLPAGLTQIYARTTGYAPFIEKTTLRRGKNAQTVSLQAVAEVETGTSGS